MVLGHLHAEEGGDALGLSPGVVEERLVANVQRKGAVFPGPDELEIPGGGDVDEGVDDLAHFPLVGPRLEVAKRK